MQRRTKGTVRQAHMCVLAPAALVDAKVLWQRIDDRHVRGEFSNGGQTVGAVLTFNDDHQLIDFCSDDRMSTSVDGKTLVPQRWSTPIGNYRSFGARRVGATGEGRWHATAGEYTYLEFHVDEITYNAGSAEPGTVPVPTAASATG